MNLKIDTGILALLFLIWLMIGLVFIPIIVGSLMLYAWEVCLFWTVNWSIFSRWLMGIVWGMVITHQGLSLFTE